MGSSVSGQADYSQFGNYKQDITLMQTALAYKTQKLSENRAALQNARDTLGMLDVAKNVDQKYLDDRLSQTTDIINKYANGDLSNDGLAQSLVSHMGQVLDSNVKNALTSTKRYQAEQSEWAKMREKAPKEYSSVNHSYSNRGSDAWLNDNKVGSTYSGGGGYIPYTDVGGIIQKALPDIQKALEAKGKRIDVNGMALDTYQEISRGDMAAALNGLLTGDAQKQLEINAWATYGQLPDDALATEWDNHITPKITDFNNKIDALKALKNSATDTETKKAYQNQIDMFSQQKSTYEDSDYETVISSIGKEGMYTALHKEQFLDGYLDAYSYGPKLVERKIDEVQKFNMEYSLKLATFDETKRHNKATEETAAAKAKKEAGAAADAFSIGQELPVDSDKTRSSVLNDITSKNIGTHNIIKNELVRQGLTEGDVRSQEFQQALKNNRHLNKTMEINGKTVTISKDFRKYLNDHKENVIETPPEKKQAFQSIEQMTHDIQTNLRYAIKTGNTDLASIPEVYVKHAQNKNGSWSLQRLQKGDKGYDQLKNRYRYLVQTSDQQEKWTEKDKKDFKLYTTLQLKNDEGISTTQRTLLTEKMFQDVSPYLDSKSLNMLTKGQGAYMENTKGRWRDKELSDIGGRDVKSTFTDLSEKNMSKEAIQERIKYLQTQASSEGISDNPWEALGLSSGEKATEEAIKHYRGRLAKGDYNQLNIRGIDKIVQDGFKAVEGHLESAYLGRSKESSNQPYVISHTKDTRDLYNKVAHLAGFESSAKKDISIIPYLKDGVPTDYVQFSTLVKDKDGKMVRTYTDPVPKSAVEKAGIANIDLGGGKGKYSATSPYARTLSLGNGNYSDVKKRGLDGAKEIIAQATTLGMGPQVQNILSLYEQGQIEAKLEPIEGNYYVRFYQNGKLAFGGTPVPTNTRDYSESDISEMLDNPKALVDAALTSLIISQLTQ
jgi:hypothetical protein